MPLPLFVRAAIAFMAMPGVVAYAVPWLFFRPSGLGASLHPGGALLAAAGTTLLVWCVRDFYIAGRGTLAPWAPPSTLVVVGLYRVSRNPMYLAVLTVLSGWAIGWRSWSMALYALAIAIAFHLRVVRHEEPWLAKRHGEAWARYRVSVPRWLLRGRRR